MYENKQYDIPFNVIERECQHVAEVGYGNGPAIRLDKKSLIMAINLNFYKVKIQDYSL